MSQINTTPPSPSVFKVDVKYADDAHPPQRIAVSGPLVTTAEQAEQHCLKTLKHIDDCGVEHSCVSAVRVRNEPFTAAEVPRVLAKEHAAADVPLLPDNK